MKKSIILITVYFSYFVSISAQWTVVGTDVNALTPNAIIYSIATDPSGNVYAAGQFTNSNGKQYVAKWNGTGWGELGTGVNALDANAQINSLATDANGNVYAAGNFSHSSSFGYYVAKWNGTLWTNLTAQIDAINFNDGILAIAVDTADNVYAAGWFSNANRKYYVSKWDGSTWAELGAGSNALNASGSIVSITFDKSGNLYAAGRFKNAAGRYYVAKWNGTNWAELGTGTNALNVNNEIGCITTDNSGNVYAAGKFTNSDGSTYVIKWNGSTWKAVDESNLKQFGGTITSISTDNFGNLYTSGSFRSNNIGNPVFLSVYKWDGFSWTGLGPPPSGYPSNGASTLAFDKAGNLYSSQTTPFGYPENGRTSYGYVAKYSPTALPVTLSSFTVFKDNKNIRLQWNTSQETNSSYYEIYKSEDGARFNAIGNVKAKGSGSIFTDYIFDDTHPLVGNNYYKIKLVENNGNTWFSDVKKVSTSDRTLLKIYPNPTGSVVSIENNFLVSKVVIDISDLSGKKFIHSIKTSQPIIQIYINSLAAGTYIMRISDGTNSEVKRIAVIKL